MARDATRVSGQRAEQSTWPLHRFVISPVSLSPLVERSYPHEA